MLLKYEVTFLFYQMLFSKRKIYNKMTSKKFQISWSQKAPAMEYLGDLLDNQAPPVVFIQTQAK